MDSRIQRLLNYIDTENVSILDDFERGIIDMGQADNFLSCYSIILSWIEEIYEIDTSDYRAKCVLKN